MKEKFLIVDGNSMLFRAYYATVYGKKMSTSTGIPTNAVFGFATMIQKAIDIVKPQRILIAFDAGKHTFRHDIYPEYKGGRKPAPDDLVPQFALVREFCDSFPIKWVEMQDIEADDLIGTVSKHGDAFDSYILTSDHDMLQLVDDTTSVLLMKKGITDMDVMTPEKLKEEMGIDPLQIIDLKGLMGDTSDNYPGIAGVGEKTALKLLKEYGSVENILNHETEIKGALGKKIIAGHEAALLSKRLATIRRDVTLDFTLDDCVFTPDYPSLIRFLKSLEMNALARRYEESNGETTSTTAAKPTHLHERVQKVPLDLLQEGTAVFLDEDHNMFLHAAIHGIALTNGQKTVYIAIDDIRNDMALLAYLKDPTLQKIGFDVKRMYHIFHHENIEVTLQDDAMILASLADSTLTSIAKIYDHYNLNTTITYETVYGKANKPVLFVDEAQQLQYACQNADNIYRLYHETITTIQEYEMMHLYRNIEMPLTTILCDMEEEGICCNVEVLDKIAQDTYAKIQTEQQAIYKEANKEFNINSPKQLAEVLYDDLALPSGKKRSTSADKLEKLAGVHPIIDHILVYRKLSKIYSTYAEGLKKYIQNDGKIHTIYNQAATQTGRLSSSEPNLQNISVRDEQGKEIRKAFIPSKGCVLLSSDYHQIELRMLAHMANETGLIEAFQQGIDAHTKTAMDIFGVTQDEVTPQMRRRAKTVNFGVVYGISDFGLAEQLGVSRYEAKDFIDTYYEKYPGIRTYMQNLVKDCEKKGYVTTLSGRRRDIPEIHDKNRMVREFGQRAAMNAPIQGSAADLIKMAMIKIDQMMKEAGVTAKMILQVHDELIFDVPLEEVEQMKQIVNDGMTHAMELKVPLTAECSIGNNWYEAK